MAANQVQSLKRAIALLKAIDEATVLARQYEKEQNKVARDQMINEYGASLYEIDKQPIIDATAEVFSSFGKANGLTEMIERIQAL